MHARARTRGRWLLLLAPVLALLAALPAWAQAPEPPLPADHPRNLHARLPNPGGCYPWSADIPAPGWRETPAALADSIVAYGRRLTFVDAPGRSHRRDLGNGNWIAIMPVAELRCDTDRRDDGRVVAKIESTTDTLVNGRLVPRGTTYLWMRGKSAQFEMALVPAAAPQLLQIPNPRRIHEHGRTRFGYAAFYDATTGQNGTQRVMLMANLECDLGCCGGDR